MMNVMEPSTYFVSDLHLFSGRTQAARHAPALHAAARRARTFVLGGDIFDFRWSTLGSVETTVRARTAPRRPLPPCNRHHFSVRRFDSTRNQG